MSLKRISFFDGHTSETQPTITNVDTDSYLTFANDAAYESSQGAASAGDVYYNITDNVVRYYNGSAWVTKANLAENQTFAGNIIISGDLAVNGTTTTINTTNLDVTDKNITVNDGGNDASSEGAGITVERTGTDGSIIYADAAATKFKIGSLGSEIEAVDISTSQTLTNKTLTSPVLNTGVSGTAIKDEDDMASDSSTHLATQQSIKAYVDANAGALTGSVIAYAGTSTPTGYLACEGQAVSRTTYSALFTAIGTAWGVGDGSTTFNLPDGRSGFLVGAGTGTKFTVNTNRSVGDYNDDAFQDHEHPVEINNAQVYSGATSGGGANNVNNDSGYNTGGFEWYTGGAAGRTSTETLPNSMAVKFIIKT